MNSTSNCKALAGVAAIDSIGGEGHGFANMIGMGGCDQGGGGIQHHNIAPGRALALEYSANDGSVLLRIVAAADRSRAGRCAGQILQA